jgi:hypothetical protein
MIELNQSSPPMLHLEECGIKALEKSKAVTSWLELLKSQQSLAAQTYYTCNTFVL